MDDARGLRIASRASLVVLLLAVLAVEYYLHVGQRLSIRAHERHGYLMAQPGVVFVVKTAWLQLGIGLGALIVGSSAVGFGHHTTTIIVICRCLLGLVVLTCAFGIAIVLPFIGFSPEMPG